MEDQEEKLKCTIYVSQDSLRRWESGCALAGCKSRSNFAERAINFYAGHLSATAHTDYFAQAVNDTLDGLVSGVETRLARLHFKSAVEMAKMAHVLAAISEVDEGTLARLHLKCVEEVKRINGVVRLEDATKYQRSG